jgi:hypothetical protein
MLHSRMLRTSLIMLLHEEESPLGWRAFILFMVAVLGIVVLFDQMARRAIRNIRRRKSGSPQRSTRVGRLHFVVTLRRFLTRVRR